MSDILSRDQIIGAVQSYCANLLESEREWNGADALYVATLLNQDDDPVGLFRLMDEQTGSTRVGYRTRDGREWFPILRQMRNKRDSGLLENLDDKA
jgi:hypothetical protein